MLVSGSSFAKLDDRSLRVVTATLLCKIWQIGSPMATCDVETLLTDGRNFDRVSERDLTVIIAQLLCEILNSGGSGATCLLRLAANVTPAIAPPCPLSIAAGPGPNEGVWFGDSTTGVWEEIIAPGP